MNIEAYIQSGIIESYVLGLATPEEVAELEALGYEYPEIRKAVEEFSALLERQALEHTIVPPASVKQKVLAAIKDEKNDGKVISFAPLNDANSKKLGMWRMAAAACIILFAVSACLNAYLYSQYRSKSEAYRVLAEEKNTMLAANHAFQTKLNQWHSAAEMMANTAMKKITLDAMPGKQSCMATLFWDRRNKEVYVMTNHLPSPASGKQYQLWAIVNGKPVDAGMMSVIGCEGACQMKTIPKAEAFAISLENEGGSVSPTADAIYVLGKTSS